MENFLRIFGWPHELLHVLALLLIGRRPESVNRTHVDIPADLSTRQYVFVAGLPALVFGGAALISFITFLEAPDMGQSVLRLVITGIFSIAALGTMGDIALIIERLTAEKPPT